MLRNGSHRLAFFYLKKIKFIHLSKLIDYPSEGKNFCNYGIDWFKNKNFSEEELNIINNEIKEFNKFIFN